MSEEPKIWAPDRRMCGYDCIVHIYEAIKKLGLRENFSMVDIASGNGLIMDALIRLFPKAYGVIVDSRRYPEWERISPRITKLEIPFQKFIQNNIHYDIVIMLDMYRMWDDLDPVKKALDKWILENSSYFLTSAAKLPYEKLPINGFDLGTGGSGEHGFPLELYKIPCQN